MNDQLEICYLCGEPLAEPISDDHVPPKQMFAKELRKTNDLLKMLTIRTHESCNNSFGKDEHYFFQSLLPFARGSYSGNAALREAVDKFHSGSRQRFLMKMILGEFERHPSGLVLPNGRVAKRFQGDRIERVAWKIVRGLYFHHFGVVLPDEWTVGVTIIAPNERPPSHFDCFMNVVGNVQYGEYPGVFAYRFHKFIEANNLHYWAMLLWDRVIITVLFHDPSCTCRECLQPSTLP
ncbi:MAG: hypothetical protein NUV50_03510 [Rhodospirillales bacterium]|nr:hypothetical protein [Rhodospirillales bacterium]